MSRLSWPSRQHPEEGFTLIEVVVAMGVMFSALVVLAYTMLSGLSAVGFSRQRTEATALANQALEQIRALPGSQLFMSSSDVSSDPTNLVSCGSNTCFNSRQVPVANFGTNLSTNPLSPHISAPISAAPGNTQYTVASYLTYDHPGDTTTLVATVQVSWTNAQRGGVANRVQVESKIYNAQFNEAPPGTHSFVASAQGQPGIITIRGTVLNQQGLDATFNLPSTSAGMNGTSFPNSTNVGTGAGVTSVTAGIAQSGISAVNGTVQILKTPAATKSAQSAAGSFGTDGPRTDNQTPVVLATLPGVLGITGSLGATVSAGSTASASAVAASAASGGTSTPGSPNLPNNGLGFGQASASQSGAVAANLNVLGLLGVNLVNIGLVNVVPTGNGSPDLSTVAQSGSSSAPQQQTFSAGARQQLSDVDILDLPLLGFPLLKLTAFDQQAYALACAAPPPAPCNASPPVDTGSLQILGGAPIPVQTLLNDTAPALALVNQTLKVVNLPLGVATVTVGGAGITLGTPASSSPGMASVPSPIAIDLTVNVSLPLLGLTVLNVVVHVDLGSVSATARYT